MVGFEIVAIYRDRRYTEWAVERPDGTRCAQWCVYRKDALAGLWTQFGMSIEPVFGAVVNHAGLGYWMWVRDGKPNTLTMQRDWAASPARTAPWRPASNGGGPRHWFLYRDVPNVGDRYHTGAGGQLIRYGSSEAAKKAAERLNGKA